MGQLQAAGAAVEQRLAQVQFQRSDVLGDRGLGHVQLGRGLGEGECAGGGLEGAQPGQRGQIGARGHGTTYA